ASLDHCHCVIAPAQGHPGCRRADLLGLHGLASAWGGQRSGGWVGGAARQQGAEDDRADCCHRHPGTLTPATQTRKRRRQHGRHPANADAARGGPRSLRPYGTATIVAVVSILSGTGSGIAGLSRVRLWTLLSSALLA